MIMSNRLCEVARFVNLVGTIQSDQGVIYIGTGETGKTPSQHIAQYMRASALCQKEV